MKHPPIDLFPGCTLRDMTQYDIDEVYDIETKRRVPGQGVCPKSVFKIRLDMPSYWSWVVCLGKSIVAFGVLRLDDTSVDWLKLASAYTDGMLFPHIARVVQVALRGKYKSIVGRCSEELWPLYQRQGVDREGTIPNFFGPGKDAVALRFML